MIAPHGGRQETRIGCEILIRADIEQDRRVGRADQPCELRNSDVGM